MRPFDVVFCDTCIGGSTVAARLARARSGIRGFFLADYAVNPLGVKAPEQVRKALDRWVEVAAARAPLLVIACNTASVRLRDVPEVVERARSLGTEVVSMVDLLANTLAGEPGAVARRRVCLMGTRFTVSHPLYRGMLGRAGAREVLPLPATATEGEIAHLRHHSREGRDRIRAEIGDTLREADTVVMACTCFPLVADLIEELNPGVRLLDPAEGIETLPGLGGRGGPNRLSLAVTGEVLTPGALLSLAPALLPGWELVEALRLETLDGGPLLP